MKNFFKTFIKSFVIVYVIFVVSLYLLQDKLIFHPGKTELSYQYSVKTPFEERWIPLNDIKLHSILFKSEKHKGLILYFHGNASTLVEWAEIAEEINKSLDWDVWMIDYPGYGKSEGAIQSEEQLHNMAKSLYDKAVQEFPNQRLMIFGRSLGTGIAIKLASENKSEGLILEAPYYSIERVARERYPIIPPGLVKYPLRSYEWFLRVTCPILMFHGVEDQTIPYQQGKDLSELNSKAKLISIQGAEHDGLRHFPVYWESLMNFTKE